MSLKSTSIGISSVYGSVSVSDENLLGVFLNLRLNLTWPWNLVTGINTHLNLTWTQN